MKKLKLELDRIQVLSFEAGTTDGGRGTANAVAAEYMTFGSCGPYHCVPLPQSVDVC
ncbi:MAG TPA: hypothetical protein VHG91_18825 [Longimicrobium sp.]|nr:hypothetical protein [Longimicrobium sp.]